MSALIPITGIPIDYRVPGAYAEILFAQGPASAAAGVRDVVFVMPKLAAGTWTANTRYRVPNTATAEAGAGAGSPLHRAIRKFMAHNKDARVWAVPVAATTGGSPVQATAVLTLTDAATGAGTLEVDVCGETASFTFPSGTSISDIGDGIEAAINAKTWLPVTASNSSGTVTLTAKLAGASQGTATVGVIRVRARITAGITTTAVFGGAFLGTGTAGADGTTTEAAQLATALATLDSVRNYYIVTSAVDATSLGNLKTHITNKSEPKRGLRSVGIAGYTHSLSACQTIATTLNYERISILHQINSEHDAAELAAVLAAVRQKHESVDTAHNFSLLDLTGMILPAYDAADWPDGDDLSDAINDGISPVSSSTGRATLVMSVNTRSKNSAGTVDDFRATETHRVSVCDEFVDEELNDFALNYLGKKLKDDQLLQDGKFNPNQKVIPNVITPSAFKPHIAQRMDRYVDAGKLQNVEASKASLRVVKTGARLECGFDLHVIDHLNQASYRVAEVSTG